MLWSLVTVEYGGRALGVCAAAATSERQRLGDLVSIAEMGLRSVAASGLGVPGRCHAVEDLMSTQERSRRLRLYSSRSDPRGYELRDFLKRSVAGLP